MPSAFSADGFDHYADITLMYAASSAATIIGAAARTGPAGVRTEYNDTFFVEELTLFGQVVAETTIYVGIAFRLRSLPLAGDIATIFQFMETDETPQVAITVDEDGLLGAYKGNSAGVELDTAATNALTVGPYYYIEAGVFLDNTTGTVEVRLWTAAATMTTPINFTGDTQNGGTGLISLLGFGTDLDTAISPAADWDDKYVSLDGFLGNKAVTVSYPSGAGFYTEWAPSPPPTNYNNVNETAPDSDATYNYAPSTDQNGARVIAAEGPETVIYDYDASPKTATIPDFTFSDKQVDDVMVWQVVSQTKGAAVTTITPPAGWTLLDSATDTNNGYSLLSQIYWKVLDSGDLTGDVVFEWTITGTVFVDNEPPRFFMNQYRDIDTGAPFDDFSSSSGAATDTTTACPTIDLTGADGGYVQIISVPFFTNLSGVPATPPAGLPTAVTPSGFTTGLSRRWGFQKYCGPETIGEVTFSGWEHSGTPSTNLLSFPFIQHAIALRSSDPCGIAAEGKDTFPTTAATACDGVVVHLCARLDGEDSHAVGAVTRLSTTDDLSYGVEPDADYHYIQFPYPLAPDAAAWDVTKFNATEKGYNLDAEGPPTPPSTDPIFLADAELITGFADTDPMEPTWVEAGIHAYTMVPADTVAANTLIQTYSTGGQFPDATQASIVGLTEPLIGDCQTNTGFYNATTDSDLFLDGAFTIITAIQLTALTGCSQSGGPVLMYRKGNAGDVSGWRLEVSNDDDVVGTVIYKRFNSIGGTTLFLFSLGGDITLTDAFLITVICDGATVKMRVNGGQTDSIANVPGTDPGASDFWFLNLQLGQNAPQGDVPLTKVWARELDVTELGDEESAAALRYGITL